MQAAAFVGRQAELERLGALAGRVRAGDSAALVVAAPPGLGKSCLLDRLAAEHEGADGLCVLRARGVQTESDLPFAALDALLRPVLHRRDALAPVQRDALERALALAGGDPPDQFAVGAATLSLLAEGVEAGGVLCLVDDVQWIDPSSLRALAFAARRLTAEAVGIVFAVREADGVPPELHGVEVMRLDGLDDTAARAVLDHLSDGRVPDDVAAQLVAAADGSPLALVELAGRLGPAQLQGREALVGPPPPPRSAGDLLLDRVAELDHGSCLALLVAAAADSDDTALVARALEEVGLGLDHLAPAEASGLVELRPHRIALRHPLVRSVAYHHHAPERRRTAHAAVAAALPPEDRRRPWHLAEAAAAPDEEVARALLAGAADARRRGGHPSAARAERRAADLTPDPETRAQRLLEAADDFELAGLNEEARAVLDEAAGLARTDETLARVRGTRAHHVLYAGDPAGAIPGLLAQADLLAERAPTSAARYLIEGGWGAMLIGELDAWRDRSARAIEVLGPDGDRSTRRTARAMHAAALVALGREEEARPELDAVLGELLDPASDRERILGAVELYGLMAHALVWLERFADADRLLTRLIGDARAVSAGGALPYLLGVRVALDLRLGRFDSAAAAADEGVALAEAAGSGGFHVGGVGTRALVRAIRGDTEGARADALEALRGSATAAPRLAMFAYQALGTIALADGDLEEAVTQFDRSASVPRTVGFLEPGGQPFQPDRLEALIRHGDPRAEEEVAAWEAVGERTGRLFARATAARCRALMAPDDEVDAAFARARALHDELPFPFERARTLLAHGERLRRARRRADARGPLREALAAFEALPAPAWAARARSELRATGGMVPARTRPQTAELTPHEIQVAMMVAEGRTNREVAAALFLAPKTIEHHLSAIFRKLGIRRRTELARFFAGELAA